MLSGPVQFIFGSVRFEESNNWSWVAVSSPCSHSVANINVTVGDMNSENFPKLDDFFGNIFFGRLGDTVYFKIMLQVYCSKSSIWLIAVLRSLATPFRSSFRLAISSSALHTLCLSKLTSCLSTLFSVSKLSTLLK